MQGPGAIHEFTRPGAWPCEGLQQGLVRKRGASRYLGKNTGVVNGSLHSLPLSFHIYFMHLGCVLTILV
jgi:hypothetical protein